MSATDPQIVSRQAWGANPLQTPAGTIAVPSKELWLHHSAGEQFDEAGMRMLQSFTLHRSDASYVDLEYTFVVDHVDCRVFESRGVGRNTAATGGWTFTPWPRSHNAISHAVCVMGNFQVDEPSDALVRTLANLVAWGFERGWWPLGFTGGHRDASGNSTACPGDHLEPLLSRINALAIQIHGGTVTPPGPPHTQSGREEPMLIPSPKQQTPNRFDGVKVDIAAQSISNRGAGVCAPNPTDAIGTKKWDGAYQLDGVQPDGFRHFVVVTTDLDEYEFHVK